VLRILELLQGGAERQDPFAAERGAERQHRGRDLPLAQLAPGYEHNARAARAVLRWLQAHCPEHLDPALLAAVTELLDHAEVR
jgi:hypothetical protein